MIHSSSYKDTFKRKSFVVVLLVSFWFGYTMLSIIQTVFSSIQIKKKIEDNKNKEIEFILLGIKDYLMSENDDIVKRQLKIATNLHFIDYYCFRKITDNKEVILSDFTKKSGDSACAIFNVSKFNDYESFMKYSQVIVRSIKVDDYILTVAYASDLWAFLTWEHKENLIPFLKDIFIITVFVGILIFLILKDFVVIEQLLKKGNRDKLSKMKATSKEAQTLIDSTRALDSINIQQKENIHFLQNTVGDALATEIYQQTPSLTSIPVSVVRIDLNGYTQIFLEKKEEHIVSVLNEYFQVTNDIIKRYQGEIYQIIGDEVIFIFKDPDYLLKRKSATDELDHKLKALFSVKAIFEWSKKLDKKISDHYGHRFLLKASISSGMLKFVKLNTGFAFAGVPLIESVRLLGSVSDKNENTLIVIENEYLNFQNFFPISNQKITHLKGFEESVKIFEIKEFSSLEEYFTKALNTEQEELFRFKMKYLDYFKSQDDVLQMLLLVHKYFLAKNYKPIFYLLQSLKKVNLSIPDTMIAQRLYQVLIDNFAAIQLKSTEFSFLSGLVLLVKNLVHKELWSDSWNQLLKNYLLSNNPRVVANASDVYYFYHDKIDAIKSILTSWRENNRISALYILAKLKRELTKKDAETVIHWLKSNNPLFQASALYLIEEIIKFYAEKDKVMYQTNDSILDLKVAGLQLLNSPNEMVKSRAESLKQCVLLCEENLKIAA